jgi:3',5'-cyclic-nucleotide phosphodiesterase
VLKLSELNQASIVDLIPTLVLIDIPYDDQLHDRPSREIRTPSPGSTQHIDGLIEEPANEEAYGLKLLQWIASEIQYQSLSKLIVPVALVTIPALNLQSVTSRGRAGSKSEAQVIYDSSDPTSKKPLVLATPLDQVRTMRYLDTGAVDVLTSPLLLERLPSLAIHAYRAHKDASKEQRALLEMKRGRKRSWVGVDDQKPYAYLREAMVSGLMDGICRVGGDNEPLGHIRISVALDRREKIAAAVGSWHFSAHDFTDDELLHAALLMLQHALAMPELERWRISTGKRILYGLCFG